VYNRFSFLDVEIPPFNFFHLNQTRFFLDDARTESRFAYFWKTYLKLPLSTSLSLSCVAMWWRTTFKLTPSRRMKQMWWCWWWWSDECTESQCNTLFLTSFLSLSKKWCYCRWDEDEDVSWHGWVFPQLTNNLWTSLYKNIHNSRRNISEHGNIIMYVLDIFFLDFLLVRIVSRPYSAQDVIPSWQSNRVTVWKLYIYLNIYILIYICGSSYHHILDRHPIRAGCLPLNFF